MIWTPVQKTTMTRPCFIRNRSFDLRKEDLTLESSTWIRIIHETKLIWMPAGMLRQWWKRWIRVSQNQIQNSPWSMTSRILPEKCLIQWGSVNKKSLESNGDIKRTVLRSIWAELRKQQEHPSQRRGASLALHWIHKTSGSSYRWSFFSVHMQKWDALLKGELKLKWCKLVDELEKTALMALPRCYYVHIREKVVVRPLHVLCDAFVLA